MTGNYIYDATDVAGISLTDPGPFKTPAGDGDSRGTRVYDNTIYAQSAYIKAGVPSGPNFAWSQCGDSVRNDGARIDYNTVKGAYVGYAFPVDGVRNWTVTNNADISSHPYPSYLPVSACYGAVAQPGRFQKYSARSSGTFSGNNYPFVETVLNGASSFNF